MNGLFIVLHTTIANDYSVVIERMFYVGAIHTRYYDLVEYAEERLGWNRWDITYEFIGPVDISATGFYPVDIVNTKLAGVLNEGDVFV